MRSSRALYAWREQICNNYPRCEEKRAPGGILCPSCEAKERALVDMAKRGRYAWPPGWQMPVHKVDERGDGE
jgi:hypothetical protein